MLRRAGKARQASTPAGLGNRHSETGRMVRYAIGK